MASTVEQFKVSSDMIRQAIPSSLREEDWGCDSDGVWRARARESGTNTPVTFCYYRQNPFEWLSKAISISPDAQKIPIPGQVTSDEWITSLLHDTQQGLTQSFVDRQLIVGGKRLDVQVALIPKIDGSIGPQDVSRIEYRIPYVGDGDIVYQYRYVVSPDGVTRQTVKPHNTDTSKFTEVTSSQPYTEGIHDMTAVWLGESNSYDDTQGFTDNWDRLWLGIKASMNSPVEPVQKELHEF